MTQPVTLPLWLFVLIVLFAGVTFASHFLFPSVRWFFRRRAERVVDELNKRLQRPIEPFKLSRRYDMIQRLIYDPEVTRAVVRHARDRREREDVAFETARRYAREIVPAFSATAYFGWGTRIARWLARSLFNVKVTRFEEALAEVPEDATVVFVMNHRSNMDYVLVTYLVSGATTLSYAVGEWARVWPLSAMVKMMGAYFIRRRSRGLLYRKVLARYVQMATANGVTQAFFPEGGLSLDGRLAEPKLGLLSYLMEGEGADRLVFVPVALAYDRVIEDRILIRAHAAGERRFGVPATQAAGAVLRHFWLRLTRRFRRFGEAAVSFGTPLRPGPEDRENVAALAQTLLERIGRTMPALAVPLTARAISCGARGEEIAAAVARDIAALDAAGVPRTEGEAARIAARGLARLNERGIVTADGTPVPGEEAALSFYAASLAQHFPEDSADAKEVSASAKQ
ncbi:1-acyl-sn-glycerol-3-phosphate acyltransferase [Histidinibacterium aquaticum]|uniref:Glycerol-3-phosphate acyltransferase n=1 Tax=Histidinibacterium aquaticum TaxID=2613962 RepID=A0A5J5GAS9_9RHOB|nr:1-acyl-sn-glycerol-3-phosphate acyltransferase [Histidinibacterium aquaticum]KAA9005217.1 glycerol-3-phosphate acyltransferase [Histidinibacterium aquaticum]